MALWSGRFEGGQDSFLQQFGASLPVDRRMYVQDVEGSIAHARMLAAQGIISSSDAEAICAGLSSIRHDIACGTFMFDEADEDIHRALEAELTRRIGDAGARLHTARSRNDQVATDTRLFAKTLARNLMEAAGSLREALIDQAQQHMHTIMPGYTHMQHAQPVLLAHHFLAYSWMLARDHTRLMAAFCAADCCPLGSAALAGTSWPIDREATAHSLGFAACTENSLDAVSDRDFLLDLLHACTVMAVHLSRLCEELILWSTSEFGFVTLSDAYSTGSSIMPQKKNPDFAELIRGKTGRVVGDMVSLLVTLKGLPLAYNKDMQEDKSCAFDAADTLLDCLRCATGMVSTMTVHADAMRAAVETGYLAATDVADYLAKKGLPFRQAHEVVGRLVLLCDKRGCELKDLTLEDLRAQSDLFEADVVSCLSIESIVDARVSQGGTAPAAVTEQLEHAKQALVHDREAYADDQGALGAITDLL